MPLVYDDLNETTRQFMLNELDYDILNGNLYMSPRLNEFGQQNYVNFLKEAVERHDDEWLAEKLRAFNCLDQYEQRRKPKGGFTTVRVPTTAAETLAEGEFNRYYARGLAARALAQGIQELEVYRAKEVSQPRPQSEDMIGRRISATDLLHDLRRSPGVEPALGLPPGPNSGLTVRLPRAIVEEGLL